MDDINKNIEEYNLNKKRKILIVFDDMIADMPWAYRGYLKCSIGGTNNQLFN